MTPRDFPRAHRAKEKGTQSKRAQGAKHTTPEEHEADRAALRRRRQCRHRPAETAGTEETEQQDAKPAEATVDEDTAGNPEYEGDEAARNVGMACRLGSKPDDHSRSDRRDRSDLEDRVVSQFKLRHYRRSDAGRSESRTGSGSSTTGSQPSGRRWTSGSTPA